MTKRIFSFFLCLLLLISLALPVCAKEKKTKKEEEPPKPALELRLTTVQGILDLAENCRMDSYSQNILVTLERDLDFTGVDFESIPIFSGTFDGKGHTITGLHITSDGSVQGLFRYLTPGSVVQNLHIEGQIQPGGSRSQVGAIAGHNEGTIVNCSFRGSVSGSEKVGGIAGSNAIAGIIESCTVSGELFGDHFVGGIAGENYGVIRNCINEAPVNTTPQQNTVEISNITLDTLTNSESPNTVTDIGGIAGLSSGVIRSCENQGQVGYQHMGYNIGGIAGTQTGYIADCKNHAAIQGRKEVGGIVGQMEPVALIEYKEDALQILKKQLSTMTGLVNRASSNAESNAGQISGQIGALYDQTRKAWDAVDLLIPGKDEPLPDADSILAARNTLTGTFNNMSGTLNGIAYATQETVNGLTHDLRAISNQISAMGKTIDKASENLGSTITDVSDDDTEDNLSGKVERCENHGAILADLNAGGITGAIAMENDLDILEDWETYGERSMNIHSKVRAVILDCSNQGIVTGKKQNVGGIAGWQSMGLVKDSANLARVDGTGADHVGGISGLSTGFIRSCNAKCEILGNAYVAGIAGSATIATGNLAMVKITDASEKIGAILGMVKETERDEKEEEPPISGNHYLCTGQDYGGIDGISYAGLAQPLTQEEFLAQENLPRMFKKVVLRFLYADGRVKEVSIKPGSSFSEDKIPLLPKKEGHSAAWEGLEQSNLHEVLFDMSFQAVYTPYRSVIESNASRDNGLPVMLMEGCFKDESILSMAPSNESPELAEGETLLECWGIHVTQMGDSARFQLPQDVEAENLKLMLGSRNRVWHPAEAVADGSYLVFTPAESDKYLALVQYEEDHSAWIAAGIGAAAVALAGVLLVVKRRAKNSSTGEKTGTE